MLAALVSSVYRSSSDQPPADHGRAAYYELHFAALFNAGRGFAFPCDADGNVDIDRLPERARLNYFYARTTIGKDFRAPVRFTVIGGSPEQVHSTYQ